MTPERDIERVLKAWLEPGASKMPDRLFDTVVDRIERVPQRRLVWTNTRFTAMNPMLKFAAVAALALVVGIGVAPLAGNHDSRVSASPSPSPSLSTLPEGTYVTPVDTDDLAGLDFEDQCIDKPDVWDVQLLIRSGGRWGAMETCPGLDPEVPYAQGSGSYSVSGDRVTMIDGTEPANQATFTWKSTDDGLTLQLLEATHPDQLFAFRFLLGHDWSRMPDGLEAKYVVDSPFPIRVAFNVPPAFSTAGKLMDLSPEQFALSKFEPSREIWWVGVYLVTNVFADPCRDVEVSPPVGPSVDDLTNAMTNMVGIKAGPVTDVTIGGFHGKAFDLDPLIATAGCAADPWLDEWSMQGKRHGIANEQHQRVSILDVEGTRVVLATQTFPWTPIADEREAERVLESARFEPLASPAP